MIPGFGGQQLRASRSTSASSTASQAIILSMTPEERRRPELIKGSRRLRIAKGSGTNVQAVNQLVKQFGQMRKLMKQIGRGKMPDIGALMRQAPLTAAAAAASLGSALRLPEPETTVAVRLRLTRVGGKKDPIWRVVVADQRSPRDGRFIETVGQYNAQTEPSTITLDEERVRDWLAKGAQPTDTGPQAPAHAGHRRRRPPVACARRCASCSSTSPGMLVDEPDAVAVEQFEEDDGTVVLELVRGRGRLRQGHRPRRPHGQRAAHVVKAAAVREQRRVLVDIVD